MERNYTQSILSNPELGALSPSLPDYLYVMLNLEIELGAPILETVSDGEEIHKSR